MAGGSRNVLVLAGKHATLQIGTLADFRCSAWDWSAPKVKPAAKPPT